MKEHRGTHINEAVIYVSGIFSNLVQFLRNVYKQSNTWLGELKKKKRKKELRINNKSQTKLPSLEVT